jgi:cytochrome c
MRSDQAAETSMLVNRISQFAARACVAFLVASVALETDAQTAPWQGIGRAATPDEVKAWDIDVRGDFLGLPKGSGSVAQGESLWETKCASCHGVFGESNEVFTPIAGGTTKKDIEAGTVYNLSHSGYPQRTTLMKVSRLSTMWDYINRAMPWNAPKSLKPDEVYAAMAYILNIGDIVPADFVLSDENIAEVQNHLPNRKGKVFYPDMWNTRGKGDVKNVACMKDCVVENKITSELPEFARNAHGNIAEQTRLIGAARGTDTTLPSGTAKPGNGAVIALATAPTTSAASPKPATAEANPALGLIKNYGCSVCHSVSTKLIGPAFQEVAKKYASRADVADYLGKKIRSGGQGVWGGIQMPEQKQVSDADLKTIAQWIAGGAK